MSVYSDVVPETCSPGGEQRAPRLADEAARPERDRQLSMSERLERVHALCAQLARLSPVAPKLRR
jgi:hypothetical protein